MRKEAKEALYWQYFPKAQLVARTFCRRGKAPQSEVIDETIRAYGLLIAGWDVPGPLRYRKDRGTPINWIHYKLNKMLLNTFANKRKHIPTPMSSVPDWEQPPTEQLYTESWIHKVLHDLGDDARTMVLTIVNAPQEIAEDMSVATHARAAKRLRKYMASQGWDKWRINSAWREVSACIA